MYRCEVCHTVVPPNTPSTRIVVETREKEYPSRSERGPRAGKQKRFQRFQAPSDIGGKGQEIVRELLACPACARKHRLTEPAVTPAPAPAPATAEAAPAEDA